MGEKTKVNYLKITLMLLATGCSGEAINPRTKIAVIRNESINSTDVTVKIYHGEFLESAIHLESEEEFNEFKQQVEFLLSKLEEAKRQEVVSPEEVKYPESPVEVEKINP